MEGYVVGQVAAVLSKPGGENQIDSKLNALFTVKPKPKKKLLEESLEVPDPPLKKKKDNKNESSLKTDSKLRKNKNNAGEPDSLKTNKTTENIQGIDEEATETVHWSKLTGAARRVALKTQKPKHNTSKDHRTIFIGNLPIRLADKMKLKKLFSKYGAIENLRFRCPPTKDMTTSKRVAMIKKEFHPEKKNLIAYVCYKEEFSAEKALQMNGKEVDGYHLRVDISTNNSKSNHNKSVFVGNLPFDVNEEDIRKMFKVCGDIENIRIIRDNKTGFGKGFCYVVFKTKDCVELALKLDGNVLNKRELRVKRCMRERPEKHKSEKSQHDQPWKKSKQVGGYNKSSNTVNKSSFQGMKAKKSLKDKMKKKKIPRNLKNSAQNFKKHVGDKHFKENRHDSGNKKVFGGDKKNKKATTTSKGQRQKNK